MYLKFILFAARPISSVSDERLITQARTSVPLLSSLFTFHSIKLLFQMFRILVLCLRC